MAIGPSLSELTGLIQDPNGIKYADYGLNDAEVTRQKLLLQRASLGDERAKMQLQAEIQRQAEQGRNARASERMGFQRQKFGFEQDKFAAGEDERRRGQLEAAYSSLRDAQDRGDTQGVSYASQAIQRLGGTVEGGAGPSPSGPRSPTVGAVSGGAPAPTLSQFPESPLSILSGMPQPRGARVPLPQGSGTSGQITAGLAAQGRNPPPPGQPPVELSEGQGPAGGPPPQLPAATSFMAPEAGGAVTSGLALLGGRIPPPGGPPIQPEPVRLDESPVQPPLGAQSAPAPQSQAEPSSGGLEALGAMYYPRAPAQVDTSTQGGAQPAPDATPVPPAASPQGGGLRVLQGGKTALELGGADAPNQVRTTLQSLTDNARTPEEKRSAKIAMDTALGAVQRLGVKEAIDIGLKAYDREQNNNRKTKIGTGKGVGENFGGSGLSKSELGVRGDMNAAYRHVFDKTVSTGQVAKLNQGYNALQQALAAAGSGTSTGDILALKSVIKITDERISDADFRVMAGAGGVWSQLSSKFNQFLTDADAGRIDQKYMQNLSKTMRAAVSALQTRREQLADEVANQMLSVPEFHLGTPEEEATNREYYANAARHEMLGQAPPKSSGGSAKQPSKPKAKPPMESLF